VTLDLAALRAYIDAECVSVGASGPLLLSEKWETAAGTSRRTGVPLKELQYMREHGIGPRWLPRGHRIIYNAEDFDRWLAKCPPLREEDQLGNLVRRFIEAEGPHTPMGWEWCSEVSIRFQIFSRPTFLARMPIGWKAALWREIKSRGFLMSRRTTWIGNADGDFMGGEEGFQKRCVERWGPRRDREW
jgi:hypothetical protein